jgi:uncharacterized protein (TIGR03435 family)
MKVVFAFVLGTTTLFGQQATNAPSFDVASIKRNRSADEVAEGGFMPGGRIAAINVTLANLMVAAYNVAPDRIEGGPSWVRQDRFDVVATGNRNATVAETRLMLRSLLAERFALNSRTVARERPVFAMLPVREDRRPGPQLRLTDPKCAASRAAVESAPPEAGPPSPSDPPCGRVAFGGGLLSGRAAAMDQIATSLSGLVGRPVVNRSGFDGLYDFELRFSRPSSNPGSTDPPEIFTALREQLGLRLEAGRGPVDVIEIVSAAQPSVD